MNRGALVCTCRCLGNQRLNGRKKIIAALDGMDIHSAQRLFNCRGKSVEGGEKKVAIAGKISIEVKIRDIERLEEAVKKCVTVTKTHPYATDINIRVDETSLLCKLQRILRCVQRQLLHHLQKKDDKSSSQAYSDEM